MIVNFRSAIEHFRFAAKKPYVFFTVGRGIFKKMIFKKDVLRTVDWAMTYKCDSNCQMCSATLLYNSERQILTVEQIKDVWKQCVKLGAMHVNLTGGEPLMRGVEQLCEIIRNFQPKRFLISLVTNCLILTKKDICRLKKAGLDTIVISIESTDEQENDRIRGTKGHYKKVMEVLRYCKEARLSICLSTVVTRENINRLDNLINFAKKNGTFLLLCKASAAGRWQSREEKKMLKDDLEKFNKLLKIPHVRSDVILNYSGKMGCPGGTERMYITAYGDVMMCPHVQISYGNVLEEPVETVWKKMHNFSPIRKFSLACKHAFDPEFYRKYVLLTEGKKRLPLSIFEHPYGLKKMKHRECNICGSNNSKFLFKALEHDIVRCNRCGLVFTSDLPQEKDLIGQYDKEFFQDGQRSHREESSNIRKSAIFKNSLKRVNRLLKLKPTGNLLDIGCGMGHFIKTASQHYEVFGLEPSGYAADYAKRNLGLNISNCSLGEYISPTHFDIITLWDTIEHIRDPKGCLVKCRELLNAKGLLVLSTGDIESLVSRLSRSKWHLMIPPKHLYFFSHRTIEKILKATGFEVLKIEHSGKYVNMDFVRRKFAKIYQDSFLNPAKFILNVIPTLNIWINLFDIMTVYAKKQNSKINETG